MDLWQQLFGQQDISKIRTTRFLSWLQAAGKPSTPLQPGDTDWNHNAGTSLSETNEGRRRAEAVLIETWIPMQRASLIKRLISGEIILMRAKAESRHCEHLLPYVSPSLPTCHDFLSLHCCRYERIYFTCVYCCVSQGRVRTPPGEASNSVAIDVKALKYLLP